MIFLLQKPGSWFSHCRNQGCLQVAYKSRWGHCILQDSARTSEALLPELRVSCSLRSCQTARKGIQDAGTSSLCGGSTHNWPHGLSYFSPESLLSICIYYHTSRWLAFWLFMSKFPELGSSKGQTNAIQCSLDGEASLSFLQVTLPSTLYTSSLSLK